MRYDTRIGWSDFVGLSIFGIVVVEAFREARGVCLADFVEEAELLGTLCILLVSIGGAVSSTSQLHYLEISYELINPLLVFHTRKNSPSVELYGLHGFPLTYFKSFVNQNRSTSSILSKGSSESPIAMKVLG